MADERNTAADADEEEDEIPVMQKVAILFVALGQETCGEVMKYLSEFEIEEVTQAVANLKSISVELQDKVLAEFEQHLLAGEWVSQGGMDFARGALERAVGPRKAQEILDRVANTVSSGFYLTIRPNLSRASRFQLSTEDYVAIQYLSLFVLPQLIAVLGVFVWWGRRRAGSR